MGGKMSRIKGKVGEREAAVAFNAAFGTSLRRAVQYQGVAPDGPADLTGLDGVSIEVKRTEKCNPYKFLQQAIEQAGHNIPFVLHRQSHKKWIVIIQLEDLPRLCELLNKGDKNVGK